MADYDSDDNLVQCVESMTCGVLSQQPYWNMDQTQRAEWKRYTQQKQQRRRVQEQVIEEDEESEYTSASEEEEEEEKKGENEEEEEEKEQTAPKEEEGGEEGPAATERVDRRKLWVQYQAIARAALREEQGKQKIPLSLVNSKARVIWAIDGWAKEK